MTTIINNKGEKLEIKYYEIEKYCINEILNNKEYLEEFNEFKKKYNYFNPYFDYIFSKKKYKLLNPLLIPDTYLYNVDNNYYILNNNTELIEKSHIDFTIMNDTCTAIVENPYEINEGFFILEDGTILTNNYIERHFNSARLILNSYLINSPYIYKEYTKFIEKKGKYFQYYIVDFLTENLGIVYGKRYGNNMNIIMNNIKITEAQLNTIKRIKKYFFVAIEDYNKCNKTEKHIYRNR